MPEMRTVTHTPHRGADALPTVQTRDHPTRLTNQAGPAPLHGHQ
jgi:hypothetical protein